MGLINLPREEWLVGGHSLCPGCPGSLGLRLALKALNGKAIVINTSGCLTLHPVYPRTPLRVPWFHNAFENAGASISGVNAYLDKRGDDETVVLVFAGDGSTYDFFYFSLIREIYYSASQNIKHPGEHETRRLCSA